jgi:hypothetical protein
MEIFTFSTHAPPPPPTKLGQVFTMEKARVISLSLFFSAHHLFYHPSAHAPQKKEGCLGQSGEKYWKLHQITAGYQSREPWLSKDQITSFDMGS